jgi:hypothetical protein
MHFGRDGDLAHVFEGTGVGKVGNRSVGWFERVVGKDGDTYLVRNRMQSGRGSPTRVDGHFLKLQTDFTLGSLSEERFHFRTLSKRTRARILASADEHNHGRVYVAEKALAQVKRQKSEDLKAHVLRREQISQQGAAAIEQTKSEYEAKVVYWKGKCNTLEEGKKSLNIRHKVTVKKTQVFVFVHFGLFIFLFVFLFRFVYVSFS